MHNVNKVLDSQSNCRITKNSSWTLFLFKSGNVNHKDTLLIINYLKMQHCHNISTIRQSANNRLVFLRR